MNVWMVYLSPDASNWNVGQPGLVNRLIRLDEHRDSDTSKVERVDTRRYS